MHNEGDATIVTVPDLAKSVVDVTIWEVLKDSYDLDHFPILLQFSKLHPRILPNSKVRT